MIDKIIMIDSEFNCPSWGARVGALALILLVISGLQQQKIT
jgi:hypothetical protein